AQCAADTGVTREEVTDIGPSMESPSGAFDHARVGSYNRNDVQAGEYRELLGIPNVFDHLATQAEVCRTRKKTQACSIAQHPRHPRNDGELDIERAFRAFQFRTGDPGARRGRIEYRRMRNRRTQPGGVLVRGAGDADAETEHWGEHVTAAEIEVRASRRLTVGRGKRSRFSKDRRDERERLCALRRLRAAEVDVDPDFLIARCADSPHVRPAERLRLASGRRTDALV